MSQLNFQGIKNYVLITKGKIVAYENASDEQKCNLLSELKTDMDGLLALIQTEINIQETLRHRAFELANSI